MATGVELGMTVAKFYIKIYTATHRMGENICKWIDRQGINLQNIQTAHDQYHKTNQSNIKKTQSKNGQKI